MFPMMFVSFRVVKAGNARIAMTKSFFIYRRVISNVVFGSPTEFGYAKLAKVVSKALPENAKMPAITYDLMAMSLY